MNRRPHLPNTLSTKLLVFLIALIVIPLGTVGLILAGSVTRERTLQAGNEFAARSETIADSVDAHVKYLLKDAHAISIFPSTKGLIADPNEQLLIDLHSNAFTGYSKLAIVGLDGMTALSSSSGPAFDINHIESFNIAAAGEQAWVVDKALAGEDLVLHMHTPVKIEGEAVAVLGSPVSFDSIAAVVADRLEGSSGLRSFIVGENGNVLLSPSGHTLPEERNFHDLLGINSSQLALNAAAFMTFDADGISYIAGYKPIESLGWLAVVEVPLSAVVAQSIQTRNTALTILAIITALSLVAGLGMLHSLTTPLRALISAMEGYGQGNADIPLPETANGSDIGVLVDAFSTMRDAVSKREAELQRSKAELRQERIGLASSVELRTRELKQANIELAGAMKLKDEFVSTMSHELRTPLNIVLGLAEALQQGVYEPLNDRQLAVIANIGSSGSKLLEMVENVLSMAKVQSGELELNWQIVPVATLCKEVVEEAAGPIQRKSLNFEFRLEVDPKLTIQVDQGRTLQTLCHLMTNAVKFTPVSGSLGLLVRQDEDHRRIRFEVWDEGIGIAEQDLERIFKPFEQLDTSLARSHEGTGLGLALAKELARLQGGDIQVESELGAGSRFTLTVPNYAGFGRNPKAIANKATILLAEDNELSMQTFRDYLEHFGYELICVENGFEVLDQLSRSTPDLILMDVQMPHMDGLECMRKVREIAKFELTPIIALTGMAMSKDKHLCIEAGANEYLSKPVVLKHLLERVEAQLNDIEA